MSPVRKCAIQLAFVNVPLYYSMQVWSVPLGTMLQELPLHWDFVNCVLFSPSGQHILSAADNGIIKVGLPSCQLFDDPFRQPLQLEPTGNGITVGSPSPSQILWSDQDNLEDQAPALVYHRRFSAQFKKVGASYEPTILCYKTKEKKMQVCDHPYAPHYRAVL